MRSRVVLAALIALLAAGVAAGPALAHAELQESSPADGAVLTSPPDEVVLTFSEQPLSEGLALAATDATGVTIRLTDARVDGARVVATWPDAAPVGQWSLAYRVVADDGHPIDGVIAFTINGASPASASPTTPAPSPVTPTATTAGPAPSPAAAGDGGGSPLPLIIAALALVAVVVAALVARRRREGARS